MPIVGECKVQVRTKNNSKPKFLYLIVIDEPGPNLLGRDWLNSLNIPTNELFSTRQVNYFSDSEFPDLFDVSSVGNFKHTKVTIEVDPNVPPKFCKPRPLPFLIKEKVDKEIDKLLEQKIIEPVTFSK